MQKGKFLAGKFKSNFVSKLFWGWFWNVIILFAIAQYFMSIPESRMGRKIEKRPHDGGGSVTCSIMAWFPLFSLSLSHSLMATKHWSLWYRFKLEPFFCPSKLSDVREGLGFGRGNEVISGRFQIVSLLYSCNRCKIDPTMHKRRHYSTRISNLTLKAEFSKIFVSNFVTHCWKKNLTHEFYSILTSKTQKFVKWQFLHFW